jgi:hypothetical protein
MFTRGEKIRTSTLTSSDHDVLSSADSDARECG